MIAIELYLADAAADTIVHERVNRWDEGYGRDITDWFLQDQVRGKCWELTATVRMCASGRSFAGRWITDPFSLPDGTAVTKVGLDHGARRERVEWWGVG